MTRDVDTARGAASDAAGTDHAERFPFTKFVPPAVDARVSGARVANLDRLVGERRVVVVRAPAGSGKTTLLASWAAATTMSVAWLRTDAGDRDAAVLAAALHASADRVAQGVGRRVPALLAGRGSLRDPHTLAAALVNDMADTGDLALAIDDLHALPPDAAPLLTLLIELLPPHVRLVAATRSEPPLPLARLRVRGELAEVSASDLRLGLDDVRRALARQGVDDDATAARVLSMSGGWAAAVRLATDALPAAHAAPEAAEPPSDRVRDDLWGYLAEEVMREQPPELQSFLLETSLLEELRADVCTAVTGRADAADVLADLEARDLFVARFRRPDGDTWRYHDLFADFLRDRLRRERDAAAVAELHRRAAAALPTLAALPHLFAAGEPETAATRMVELMFSGFDSSMLPHVMPWLERLPAEIDRLVVASFGDQATPRGLDQCARLVAAAHDVGVPGAEHGQPRVGGHDLVRQAFEPRHQVGQQGAVETVEHDLDDARRRRLERTRCEQVRQRGERRQRSGSAPVQVRHRRSVVLALEPVLQEACEQVVVAPRVAVGAPEADDEQVARLDLSEDVGGVRAARDGSADVGAKLLEDRRDEQEALQVGWLLAQHLFGEVVPHVVTNAVARGLGGLRSVGNLRRHRGIGSERQGVGREADRRGPAAAQAQDPVRGGVIRRPLVRQRLAHVLEPEPEVGGAELAQRTANAQARERQRWRQSAGDEEADVRWQEVDQQVEQGRRAWAEGVDVVERDHELRDVRHVVHQGRREGARCPGHATTREQHRHALSERPVDAPDGGMEGRCQDVSVDVARVDAEPRHGHGRLRRPRREQRRLARACWGAYDHQAVVVDEPRQLRHAPLRNPGIHGRREELREREALGGIRACGSGVGMRMRGIAGAAHGRYCTGVLRVATRLHIWH